MAAKVKRRKYRLSDGNWAIDWDGFQAVIRRRMIAERNLAALKSGKKAVSGGIALFGRELEEIDIDFDGIRAACDQASKSQIQALEESCSSHQGSGRGLRDQICAICANDFIDNRNFKDGLNATNQKNIAKIRAADANWSTATEVTRTIRDLSIDAFFSLGAIVVPAPAAWKAGHIAFKAGVAIYLDEKKAGEVSIGTAADTTNFVVSLLPIPKTGKLALEVFVNSAKDTANATIEGTPLAEAIMSSVALNISETGAKQILNSGEFRAWLSKKVIPARVARSGLMKNLGAIGKAERKDLVEWAGGTPGEITYSFAKVAVGAIDTAKGSVRKCGEGCAEVTPEQFRPIANSIVVAVL